MNAYIGTELVGIRLSQQATVADSFAAQIGVTVGEAENPRKTIPIGGSRPVKEYKYANEFKLAIKAE
jgi:hypothetical protein